MLKRNKAGRQEQFYYQDELAWEVRYPKEKPRTWTDSLSSYIKEFSRETTVHGIAHVFAPDRHPLERQLRNHPEIFYEYLRMTTETSDILLTKIEETLLKQDINYRKCVSLIVTLRCFWLIVTFVAVVYAAMFITTNMQRFEMNPTMIVLEKNYRDWNVTMPAITFCVVQRMNDTRANETILRKWGQVDEAKFKYYRDFLNAVVNISYDKLDEFKQFENDEELNEISTEMEDLAFSVHVNVDPNVRSTTYEGVGGFVLTEMGLCYTVGSVVSRFIAPRQFKITPEILAFEDPVNCTFMHSDCKISVQSNGFDAKLYVHSPYEIIETNTRALIMSRKFINEITYTYDELKSELAVKKLRRSQRRCYLHPENDFHQIPFNSYAVCLAMCRQRLAKMWCGCVPYFYRPIGMRDVPVCNAKGLVCLAKYKGNLEKIIGDKEKIDCKCSHPCDVITYIIMDHIRLTISRPREELNVHWNIKKFPRSRYKRDVIYSIGDLLVSHGGTAGFFLGCSLLSIVELIYFFTLRLVCLLFKASGNIKKNYQQRRSRRAWALPAATNSNEIFYTPSRNVY